jgi:hypothetical protein
MVYIERANMKGRAMFDNADTRAAKVIIDLVKDAKGLSLTDVFSKECFSIISDNYTQDQLMKMKNVGRKSVEKICDAVKKSGFDEVKKGTKRGSLGEKTKARNIEIFQLREATGKSYGKIGEIYSLSAVRVQQICEKQKRILKYREKMENLESVKEGTS